MTTPDSAPDLDAAAADQPSTGTVTEAGADTAGASGTGTAAGTATTAGTTTVPDPRSPADAEHVPPAGAGPRRRPGPDAGARARDAVADGLWRIVDRVTEPTPGLVYGVLVILAALYLTLGLVLHPDSGQLKGNPYDQYYFEWQFAAVQHALFHFENPLFSHAMNAPTGVNLVANPQILGPAAVLSPVTWLFGPQVSFAFITVFNLAATAITWRWFLRRRVVDTEAAAWVGGLFAGFAPSMMSHSLAHPNLAGQWLVPLLVERVLRLRGSDRPVRDGIVVGLLIAAQVFVGEEILFLTALGLGLFLVGYVLMAPRTAWQGAVEFLKGAAVAIGTAGTVLAYPLAFQFIGPGSFKGIPFSIAYYSADLKSYAVWPNQELWGDPALPVDPLIPGNTEQAAALGWVLLAVVVVLAAWCVRMAAVRALLFAAAILVLLSIGPAPVFDHDPLGSPLGPSGIWNVIGDWPLFSSALPVRNALAVSWIVGVLLAIGVDKSLRTPQYWVRGAVFGGTVAALVPLLPRPFEVDDRPKIPAFFTGDAWKQCVTGDRHTIVGAPLSSGGDRTNLTWATATGAGFDIPQGPAMAPLSPTDKRVVFGRENVLWTAQWITFITRNGGGSTPPPSPLIRQQVASDLKAWNAACVVVADDNPRLADLRYLLNGALDAGVEIGGVWVWKAPAGS